MLTEDLCDGDFESTVTC